MKTQRHIHYIIATLTAVACLLIIPQSILAGTGACTPVPEECNGIDDNCDGRGDEGLYETRYCGTGACAGSQGRVCMSTVYGSGRSTWGWSSWGECSGERAPETEICDGLDNDCDGEVDEGMSSPQPVPGRPCQEAICKGKEGWEILPANAGSVCRSAADICDVEETCDGTNPNCPTDQYQPAGTACRASVGACDTAEVCNGHSSACPGDSGIRGCAIDGVCYVDGIRNPLNSCEHCDVHAGSDRWSAIPAVDVVCNDPAGRDACAIATSGRCTAEGVCAYTQTQTLCMSSDGCCPAGCNANSDNDCDPFCGNRVVEEDEICETASPDRICPERCDDSNACTRDTMTGSVSTCNVECRFAPIIECVSNDGCCPVGCLAANDNDCAGCGNGRVETNMGEICDGGGCAEGSSCNSECRCIAGGPEEDKKADEIISCYAYCDGASQTTKDINSELKAITGWNGDLICDAEIGRIILVVSYEFPDLNPDASASVLKTEVDALSWAIFQTDGHSVVPKETNWREREYKPTENVLLLMASKENSETKSTILPALSMSNPLFNYSVPSSSIKAVKDEPGAINLSDILTYDSRVSTTAEPRLSLTLGNGTVAEFDNPVTLSEASGGKKVIAHKIFTMVPRGTASFVAEGGPNVEEVKNIEDRLYDVELVKTKIAEIAKAGPVSCGSFKGVMPWEPSDRLEFTVVQSTGKGTVELNSTMLNHRGDWSDGGMAGCALISVTGTNISLAIVILFLIAILPAGALSLARVVVKKRRAGKES